MSCSCRLHDLEQPLLDRADHVCVYSPANKDRLSSALLRLHAKPFVAALTTASCTHRVARVTAHTYLHIQDPVFGFWEPGHNSYLVYMMSQPQANCCNINLSSRSCGAGVGIFMKRLSRPTILNPSVPKGTTGLEPAAYGLFRPIGDRRLVRSATPAPVMGVDASGLYLLVLKFWILRLSTDRVLRPAETPPPRVSPLSHPALSLQLQTGEESIGNVDPAAGALTEDAHFDHVVHEPRGAVLRKVPALSALFVVQPSLEQIHQKLVSILAYLGRKASSPPPCLLRA